jgi:hypothetical protein
MNGETREYLDGERSRARLSGAAADEADAWERLLATLREDVPGPAPAWLEGSVMSAVREASARRPSALRRAGQWLLRPSLTLSPLTAGLAAAALAALLLVTWRDRPAGAPAPDTTGGLASASEPVVYVQFVLAAPAASSVAVAGDFNEWDARHALEDPDADGIWTGRVPLEPGVHQYMFVIDGTEWVTDPGAERWTDDGFGNRNAVLAVAPPAA